MPLIRYVSLCNKKLTSQEITDGTTFEEAVEQIIPMHKYPFVRVYKYATLIDARFCNEVVQRSCTLVVVTSRIRASVYVEPRKATFYVEIPPETRVCDLALTIVENHLRDGEALCHMYDPVSGQYESPLDMRVQVDRLPCADFRACMKPIAISSMSDVLSKWPYRVTSIENVSSDVFVVKTDPNEGVRDYLVYKGNHKPLVARAPGSSDD